MVQEAKTLLWTFSCIKDHNVLPAPQNVSVVSINMKHVLTWSPVIVPSGNVTYSLQVEGEFEKNHWNQSWFNVSDCWSISVTWCDVTHEIAANVLYNLRVRAEWGTQRSDWTALDQSFNRVTTFLTPPKLKVQTDGVHIIVELEDLGPYFEYELLYWRKDEETLVHRKTVPEASASVHLETVEAKTDYCVKVQAYVRAINRSSGFSSPVCVTVSGGTALNLLIVFFGVLIAIVVLPLIAWKVSQMLQYSCFPAEMLPETLIVMKSHHRLIDVKSNAEEDSETVVQVVYGY
ncbi:interleukin-20 receptor subunit beta isoform X2 [Rhinatrema bivittatum]|uniref:interleukin-20 receptor subunit beta isoform X2 n=1 Tax=Rhinatrema bivittatum TaxID=194408 RepID=UPI0011274E7E|nr:interleukin-20 receptor subunit beta isoform X2 [Rhinatrema bivittatum]